MAAAAVTATCSPPQDTNLDIALAHARSKLKYAQFKSSQRDALKTFVNGKDIFVSLPTGYGKSGIYEAAPFCMDSINKADDSMVVVISPLISNTLKQRGIRLFTVGNVVLLT